MLKLKYKFFKNKSCYACDLGKYELEVCTNERGLDCDELLYGYYKLNKNFYKLQKLLKG